MNNLMPIKIITIILIVFVLAQPSYGEPSQKIGPKMLPMLLIEYAFSSAYAEIPEVDNSKVARLSQLQTLNQTLEKHLDSAGFDLSTRLVFVGESFVVQPNFIGNRYAGDKSSSILYVTTPIAAIGGKVLVILSSSAPQRTTIFELDDALNITPIYDSIGLNKYDRADKCYPVGHINSLTVNGDGSLLMNEVSDHFAGGKRKFLLRITNGLPVVVCKGRK